MNRGAFSSGIIAVTIGRNAPREELESVEIADITSLVPAEKNALALRVARWHNPQQKCRCFD